MRIAIATPPCEYIRICKNKIYEFNLRIYLIYWILQILINSYMVKIQKPPSPRIKRLLQKREGSPVRVSFLVLLRRSEGLSSMRLNDARKKDATASFSFLQQTFYHEWYPVGLERSE